MQLNTLTFFLMGSTLSKISSWVNAFVLGTPCNFVTVRHVRGGICNLQSFSVLGLGALMSKVTAFCFSFGEGMGEQNVLLCSEEMLLILFTYSYVKF